MNALLPILSLILVLKCTNHSNSLSESTNPQTERLKKYWYDGTAEITTYDLTQARYGELRKGTATMIFVTEDFSTRTYTKADKPGTDNLSVLKLNSTRKFNTGVYPYSMMNSTFFPFPSGKSSLKASSSSQEWCGHTYMEFSNQNGFKITNYSYFQSDAEKEITSERALLEDDLWTMIRISPKSLPIGKTKAIPSFFYLRLSHHDVKPYRCEISLSGKDIKTLTITYPELERTLSINYEGTFPFPITSWKETYYSGWGKNRKLLTTSGVKINSMKLAYWNKNSTKDSHLRSDLGLE